MEQYHIKVKSVDKVTHDVLRIQTERPEQYDFKPGQAAEIAINKDGWKNELRPFTFTSLPELDHLEFTIKTYASHKGMTNELLLLKPGDELIIGKSWGTIGFKGEGTFIAGGAGVTPFIAIFRQLYFNRKIGNNKLLFANKTKADIINEAEFNKMLGKNFVNILSDEKMDGYDHGYINEAFLKNNISNPKAHIYLCGPEEMMDIVETQLLNLGIERKLIVKEEF